MSKKNKTSLLVAIILMVLIVLLFSIKIVYWTHFIKANSPKELTMFKSASEIEALLSICDYEIFEADNNLPYHYKADIKIDGNVVRFETYSFTSSEQAKIMLNSLTGINTTKESFCNIKNQVKLFSQNGHRIVLFKNRLYIVQSNNLSSLYKFISSLNETFSEVIEPNYIP